MSQVAYYIWAATMGLVVAVLIAHLFDNHLHPEASMTVSEKLTDLQKAVANVTTLIQSQNEQLASQSHQLQAQSVELASLRDKLSTSESDAAALQAQIDALNSLTPPAPPAQ